MSHRNDGYSKKNSFKLNLNYCTVLKAENLDLSFDNKRRHIVYTVCLSVCLCDCKQPEGGSD